MVDDITAISECGVKSLELNTYINSKIELKKLRFHTPDSSGRTKCHKIHIGRHQLHCPVLKVHGSEMKEVSEDEYLGDIVNKDGKNKSNIIKRTSRGIGLISEIVIILDQVTFGHHYFETATLLREALFLSSMLNNVEVMYNLSKAELQEFDDVDLQLLKKLFKAPFSTPKESYYLELGIIPPSMLVKVRRILYLHYLLNKEPTQMLSMFFWTQWRKPCKGDWVHSVQADLEEFGLSPDLSSFKEYSKESFKKLVKSIAVTLTLQNLMKKKESHSKLNSLNYHSLETQSYFRREQLTKMDARTIFLFRTRMCDFWGNFRGTENGRLCPLCRNHPDKQELIAECSVVKSEFGSLHSIMQKVYSNDVRTEDAKYLVKVIQYREKIRLEKQNFAA